MLNLNSQEKKVFAKTMSLLEQAGEIFGYDTSFVKLGMDARGRAAGTAQRRRNGISIEYKISFNKEAIEKGFDHVYNHTIPHEIAHIINMMVEMDYGIKRQAHGREWKEICEMLGYTNPKRCHDIPLTKARKERLWLYRLDCGKELEITTTRHNKIQKGHRYVVDKSKKLNSNHFVGQV